MATTGIVAPPLKLPAGWTLAALVAGLAGGATLAGRPAAEWALAVAAPVGTIWLRALQMTIVPLVAALLVTGIAQIVATARACTMARRTLLAIAGVLTGGTVFAAFAMPALLAAWPIPAGASAALSGANSAPQPVPAIGAFFESLIAPNVVAAAAETAMLPLVVFFVAFALAITRLPDVHAQLLLRLFEALGATMLVIIGWVLRIAPVGVFALAFGVGLTSGDGAFAALAHYILLVSSLGVVVLIVAYFVGTLGGRRSPRDFARAMIPAQVVAISSQSSLASLPAMLQSCRSLGLRESTADFVLPLAVAVFRATSPAMNLGVAIYLGHLTGVELGPLTIAAGATVALVTTVGSVSLPGAVSFVTSIGPIAVAMGVPIEPLALLLAVEMLPDIVRTVGNVTMDVAVAASVERADDN
jgi:Na+/H+-dicarboxylate symporter